LNGRHCLPTQRGASGQPAVPRAADRPGGTAADGAGECILGRL